MMKNNHYLLFISLLLNVLLSACKEKNVSPDSTDVRDSVYYYTKMYYLWTDKLPSASDFKPTSYASPTAVIEKVKTYSPANSNYNSSDPRSSPYADRYSFVTSQKNWYNRVAGNYADFGVYLRYMSANDVRVGQVYEGSAFGNAGIKRGWRLVRVGNIDGTSANAQSIRDLINANNTLTFVFEKPDLTQQTFTLTKSSYAANFVTNAKVIISGSKKIGYFYFDSFLGNNSGQETINKLTSVFNDFASQQIDALVVDIRYNGGGYTRVQEALANLIAPATAKSKKMYTYQWNAAVQASLQQSNTSPTINFDSQASKLGISQVVFLTGYYTASASELLINNLKPYMDVKLVGDKTYGKPVGFPVLDITMSRTDSSQNIVVAPVAFKTVNANGNGDYYYGIDVDKLQTDDATHDFGDPQEACLKDAIRYLTNGNFLRTADETIKTTPEINQLNKTLNTRQSIGMFFKMP
jgi:C-terminal processing protease CtpA/Prc